MTDAREFCWMHLAPVGEKGCDCSYIEIEDKHDQLADQS